MEEKMMILRMLQEGRLSPEEAYKLLDALDKGASDEKTASASKTSDFKEEFTSKLNDMKIEEKFNKFGEKAAKFAESLGEKAGRLADQIGEKLDSEKMNNSTEKFTEEFAKRIENLGHDITESAGRFADMFSNQLGSIFEIGYEKYSGSYMYTVEENADIQFTASNFSMRVVPGDAKNILINVTANSGIPKFVLDEYFKAVIDGSSYSFSCELPDKSWGKIEIQVPESVEILKLNTDNGKCEIGGIKSKTLSCSTNNGKVYVSKCSSDTIEVFTDNGRVIIDESSARIANIRTSNAKIDINDCKLDNIDAKTTNGAVEAVGLSKTQGVESKYILSTSNGKVHVALDRTTDSECMLEASTTMGGIDVALPKLAYTLDKKNIGIHSCAAVKSDNYDTSSDKIYIKADTSNASINIGREK